ncbi:hypothetical protein FPOAC2_07215 [Fusarium poae]|uniref:hypothetical protein n=1 Tax=Fusarium poae TaxID=36050 RepID=UPI001CE9C9BC|nr:hypothetical protein FPOAC1_007064 [Fusarium poae]KAG8673746.1 hypothetical protein FPOAC1_007064 [Fusarium poae]
MSNTYIPHAGQARDGWSTEDRATATCYCGKVQLSFPVNKGNGLVNTFVCNCVDCRKITASMFASNFVVENSHLEHVRGKDLLQTYSQNETIGSGKAMTNYFCSNCGTLMYRVGERFPDVSILRIGTVDDFSLHETKLRPVEEHFTKDRVSWFTGVTDVEKSFPGQG